LVTAQQLYTKFSAVIDENICHTEPTFLCNFTTVYVNGATFRFNTLFLSEHASVTSDYK